LAWRTVALRARDRRTHGGLVSILADTEAGDGAEREESMRQLSRSICAIVGSAGLNWLISEISSGAEVTRSRYGGKTVTFLGVVVTERKLFILPAFESKSVWMMPKSIPPVDSAP
jgi:hypothetical protein